MIAYKTSALALGGLLAVLICLTASISLEKAYAQQDQAMVKTTSGGKLDVKLEPSCTNNTNCNFKVTFLQPNSQTVQVHIDYDFVLSKNGATIFDAAKSTNQQLLHTAEGSVTIPYKFNDTGTYQATVTLYGVVFVPINPETAQFPITVAPEFPSGIVIAAAGFAAVAIVTSRIVKRGSLDKDK